MEPFGCWHTTCRHMWDGHAGGMWDGHAGGMWDGPWLMAHSSEPIRVRLWSGLVGLGLLADSLETTLALPLALSEALSEATCVCYVQTSRHGPSSSPKRGTAMSRHGPCSC